MITRDVERLNRENREPDVREMLTTIADKLDEFD